MKKKLAKMTRLGTLEKKVVSDEELQKTIQQVSGYEGTMKVYKDYWFSEKFIEENSQLINWDLLCKYQPLSSKFIEKYQLEIDFDTLVTYQKVSQKILLKYREQIKVDNLTRNQPLSEKFISRYHELFEMYWANIVFYQNLSLEFLIEHKDKFDLDDLDGGKVNEETVDNFKIFTKMGAI